MGLTEASAFKDSSIGTADIVNSAITTDKVADGAVTQAKINNAVIFTPVGTVITYAGSSAPTGYLKANGDTIPNGTGTVQGVTADFSALYAVIGATLPDLRGEFIRGFDDGKGTDSGRAIRSSQTDQNKQQISWKKSGFVDSGFVKTCDELVIGFLHGPGKLWPFNPERFPKLLGCDLYDCHNFSGNFEKGKRR